MKLSASRSKPDVAVGTRTVKGAWMTVIAQIHGMFGYTEVVLGLHTMSVGEISENTIEVDCAGTQELHLSIRIMLRISLHWGKLVPERDHNSRLCDSNVVEMTLPQPDLFYL